MLLTVADFILRIDIPTSKSYSFFVKPSDSKLSERKRFLIVAIVSVLLLLLIIPAKRASFDRLGEGGNLSDASDTMSDTADYVEPSIPDSTIVEDNRPVDRAGFEDGYTSGSTDASLRQGRGTYDEQNPYPSGQRNTYVDSYREGYRQGQQFGQEHPANSSRMDSLSIEDLVRESDNRLQ